MDQNQSNRIIRIFLTSTFAILLPIGMYIQLLPTFQPIDPFGAIPLAVALLSFAGTASTWQRWRPAMSTFFAITLASWAWTTALFGMEILTSGGASGVSLLISTMLIAMAYVGWFRWAGKAEVERQAVELQSRAYAKAVADLSRLIQLENGKIIDQIHAVKADLAAHEPTTEGLFPEPQLVPEPRIDRSESIRKLRAARLCRRRISTTPLTANQLR